MINGTAKNRGLAGLCQTALKCCTTALHWWFTQLALLCPKQLKFGWNPHHYSLIVELADNQLIICYAEQKRVFHIPSPWQPELLPEEVKLIIQRAQFIELYLPAELTLETHLSLPQAAREHLHNVITFEMDRRTPFKADQVFFDSFVLPTGVMPASVMPANRTDEKLDVELQLVPKSQLQPLLNTLANIGIKPNRVAPVAFRERSDFICNLLPPREGPSPALKYQRFQWSLLACNLILLITVISFPLVQKSEQIKQLQTDVSKLKEVAEQVFDIRNERETLITQQQEFVNLKQGQISTLMLIDELTQLLPDSAWLNKIAIQGESLKMQGEASNASELIALLENSAQLTRVSFYSPVTQNPRSGKERFMISAQLNRGETDAEN